MLAVQLYNSLSRTVEQFIPMQTKKVGMYTCGPTVYSFVTIGNWRTYTLGDLLRRTLEYLDFSVDYIMNITDVGHLTGDNLGDADTGEDRLEKAALKEGKTAWDIAAFYTEDFFKGFEQLNLQQPRLFTKATDHIAEQIAMVEAIVKKGFAYKIDDGIYFDTSAYEAAGHQYGVLSTLDQIKEGARVEPNEQKRDPRDFALWKFSPVGSPRQMEWDSPWGRGFPGWHIECSAMSTKYLGEQFDIHVGGEDLRSTHHPNEIAQAEAATGKEPFVKYWVHGAFLLVDGGRMGKSLGNAYTVQDLVKKGYDPIALRYFYLSGHYRKQLNFTFEALDASQAALRRLQEQVIRFKEELDRTVLSPEKLGIIGALREEFKAALEDDLNIPQALAVVWEVVKSNVPGRDKYELLLEFDRVLGLGLALLTRQETEPVPEEVKKLLVERTAYRQLQKFTEADEVRKQIEALGYDLLDTPQGPIAKKR